MNNIYSELSAYIKSIHNKGRLLLYRNNEELAFLKEWISAIDNIKKTDAALSDESLDSIIKNCSKCKDVNNKKPGWGSGVSGIMIIMNSPANISRTEKEELKDETKELLRNMIKAIGVDLKECYVTNLIKCEAENAISRPGLMLKNCIPILIKEIQKFNPNIIIVMGDDIPIKRIINENNNRRWFKIEHPVTLIKNKELKKSAWSTLQKVMDLK